MRTNRQIRAPRVRLVDEEGKHLGIVPIEEALRLANERELDLVEVNPSAEPPVCKIADYGKLRYAESKKRSTSKHGSELKEVNVGLKISEHDLQVKINQAKKFLAKGHKVKFNLPLRGREKSFEDSLGVNLINKIIGLLAEVGVVEQKSKGLVGNRLFVIITPSRGKAKIQEIQRTHAKETENS